MAINKDTIRYVANLARLELRPDEEELFSRQLSDILAYMEKLNKLDTKDVNPMSHPLASVNIFREDKIKESLPSDETLDNAPEKEGKFFKVPKIIE